MYLPVFRERPPRRGAPSLQNLTSTTIMDRPGGFQTFRDIPDIQRNMGALRIQRAFKKTRKDCLEVLTNPEPHSTKKILKCLKNYAQKYTEMYTRDPSTNPLFHIVFPDFDYYSMEDDEIEKNFKHFLNDFYKEGLDALDNEEDEWEFRLDLINRVVNLNTHILAPIYYNN